MLCRYFEEIHADPSVNIEKDITDRMFIDVLLNELSLTEQEKLFLEVMYKAPWKSITDLARYAGFNHHKQASRMIKRLKKKLALYRQYYDNDIKCDLPYGKPKKRG